MIGRICYNSSMEDKRIKKFNRLVIKLFLAIGIISSCLAIIAELSGYVFFPFGEGRHYTLYRHYNVLTKTIEAFNTFGYLGMKKVFGGTLSYRYNSLNCLAFFAMQLLFYCLIGWGIASVIFPYRSSKNSESEN